MTQIRYGFARSSSPTPTLEHRAANPARCSSFCADESDYLYLVGDIVDGWQLKRRWYWHQLHNDVVQKVLRKARKGTQVVYVPGNHDEAARHYVGVDFGGIAIREEAIHVTTARHAPARHARRPFRRRGRRARSGSRCVGDRLYTFILKLNQHFNALRARLGLPYWSLSQFLKLRGQERGELHHRVRGRAGARCAHRGFDGVVCGHIHHAEVRRIGDILYCNSGDWVESLTRARRDARRHAVRPPLAVVP